MILSTEGVRGYPGTQSFLCDKTTVLAEVIKGTLSNTVPFKPRVYKSKTRRLKIHLSMTHTFSLWSGTIFRLDLQRYCNKNYEKYQLDATIMIYYHKYPYMFQAYRCPKHVEIFMIINHNFCIKLVPLVIFIYDARSHTSKAVVAQKV